MSIAATVALASAANRLWDVLVIGAGPAGALAARELSRRRSQVLLVDKSQFPRDKPCGGCLSRLALETLQRCGLGRLPCELGGSPLTHALFSFAGNHVRLLLDGGHAISRRAFDAALVRAAIEAGAEFLPGYRAAVQSADRHFRRVRVGSAEVAARVILVADGLAGSALHALPRFQWSAESPQRIGLGALLACAGDWPPTGRVHLAGNSGGYVGFARVEDNLVDVAAALAPGEIRAAGGVVPALQRLVSDADLNSPLDLAAARWLGTPALARQRTLVAAERLFVLGDACGYVEPFTGEGIGWALLAATDVAPLAESAARGWQPGLESAWTRRYHQSILRRQRVCRLVRCILRWPFFTRLALGSVSRAPALGRILLAASHGRPR